MQLLPNLGVHDTPTDFGSAVAGIAAGGMNKSLNRSGLVTGAFLQVKMLFRPDLHWSSILVLEAELEGSSVTKTQLGRHSARYLL